jgi:hypothetical protein
MTVAATHAMPQYSPHENTPRVGSAEGAVRNKSAPSGALMSGCDYPHLADLLGRSKRGAL